MLVEARLLGFRHLRQLAAGLQHVVEVAALGIGFPQGLRRLGAQRLDLGIFLRQADETSRPMRRRTIRLDSEQTVG